MEEFLFLEVKKRNKKKKGRLGFTFSGDAYVRFQSSWQQVVRSRTRTKSIGRYGKGWLGVSIRQAAGLKREPVSRMSCSTVKYCHDTTQASRL